MPEYLELFDGNNPLRTTHLDNLAFVANITYITTGINNLNKSFFFRCHSLWNALPFEIRNITNPDDFNSKITDHFWKETLKDIEDCGESDLSSLEHSHFSD